MRIKWKSMNYLGTNARNVCSVCKRDCARILNFLSPNNQRTWKLASWRFCWLYHNHLGAFDHLTISIPSSTRQNIINLRKKREWKSGSSSAPALALSCVRVVCTIIAFTCTMCVNFVVLHIECNRCIFFFGFELCAAATALARPIQFQ